MDNAKAEVTKKQEVSSVIDQAYRTTGDLIETLESDVVKLEARLKSVLAQAVPTSDTPPLEPITGSSPASEVVDNFNRRLNLLHYTLAAITRDLEV